MGFFSHFTNLDFVILGILLLSSIIGLFRGFLREAISLVAWFFAFFLALRFSPLLSNSLKSVIVNDTARHVLSAICIFIAVLIVGLIIRKIIVALVKVSGLGFFDRFLGLLFGAARGVLFNTIILVIIQAGPLQNSAWAKNSVIAPKYKPMVDFFNKLMPAEINKVSSWVEMQE
ncbi:MAG: CvpA family protein [Gammaproteobacteria bacterium]|nr:CvpA family protein [Gammaproteobacteria bacterium]